MDWTARKLNVTYLFLDSKYFTNYCTGSEHIAFHNKETVHFKLEYNQFFQ